MVTNVLARRILAVAVCASLGVFTTAVVAGPAFAKGKPKKHHTTTTKKKGSSSTSKGSTTLATELKKLETAEKGQKKATFIATYKLTTSSGTKTIEFAQEPPKSLFKTTSGTVIDNGTTTFYCTTTTTSVHSTATSSQGTTAQGTTAQTRSTGGGASTATGGTTCVKSTTADPLGSLLDLFSGTEALTFFNSAEEQAAAKAAGVTVSFSSGTYAGLSSKCVSVSKGGASEGKYCIASIGLLDYFSDGTSGATLQKYSSFVPSGTFTTPSGAHIITEGSA